MIREALIASTGPTLLPEFLPADLQSDLAFEVDVHPELINVGLDAWGDLGRFVESGIQGAQSNLYREAIRRFDQIIVASAMQRADGLQSKAAQILSLSRPTLRSKLREIDSKGPMS